MVLTRPKLVIASVGIVNTVEITFAVMFIVLLIWSLANYLYVSFGHLHMHKATEKVYVYPKEIIYLSVSSINLLAL